MTPYKLSPEDWKDAAMILRDRHRSIMVYGLLKKLMEGKWEGFEIWVDSWPEFKSLVMKPSGEKQMDPYTGKFYFVDSQDVASMTSLLDDPRIITWNEDINLCVADTVWPLVEQRAKDRGNIRWVADAPIYTVSRDTLVDIKVPDGFQEVPLGSDAISHVNDNWTFKVPGIDQFTHLLVERGYPTVCFRDPTGALAAYAATQFHNLLGMLTVLPPFRGKKLGTAAMGLLARKTLEEDDVVGVLVEDNNAVSIHMHTKLGFKPVPGSKINWSFFTCSQRSGTP
ncbi:glycine N-acyltransferase-like [Haliotis rubra]|uniref:glycine N-acyltransferase-like n=1 Tax=Haliotis rubra TaxID=36100 RepID=UPI001EE573A6|nr:glycine N-acyltransferase-like [Haliotis rubra]